MVGRRRLSARRLALVAAVVAGVVALVVWRGPSWSVLRDAFAAVSWEWVAAAVLLNLVSIVVRAIAWTAVIDQAMPPPQPRFRSVFSAFSIGLLGNATLPGRIGELARVAVLVNRLPRRTGLWATLVGTVFAHRVFDLVVAMGLVLYVVLGTAIPGWLQTTLTIFVAFAGGAVAAALVLARRHEVTVQDERQGRLRRLFTMARHGLGVLHAPLPAAGAIFFQALGWITQFFAVYAAMRAFQIDQPFIVAGVVLLVMNVATLFPLWPGNVGLMQAAVALALVPYGIAYAHGFGFGFGLQAIEASGAIALGLLFLAREGLSFASLRRLPEAPYAEGARGSG